MTEVSHFNTGGQNGKKSTLGLKVETLAQRRSLIEDGNFTENPSKFSFAILCSEKNYRRGFRENVERLTMKNYVTSNVHFGVGPYRAPFSYIQEICMAKAIMFN